MPVPVKSLKQRHEELMQSFKAACPDLYEAYCEAVRNAEYTEASKLRQAMQDKLAENAPLA